MYYDSPVYVLQDYWIWEEGAIKNLYAFLIARRKFVMQKVSMELVFPARNKSSISNFNIKAVVTEVKINTYFLKIGIA